MQASLYLWHVPILDALGGPYLKRVPLCLAVAFVSYRLVEAPFLRLRKRCEGGPRRITAEPPPGWREESRPTEAAGSPVAPA
jgi:peptidoglycan/LPS O-acetylase OafA/YrhL